MKILHLTDTHLGEHGWYEGAPSGWRRGDDHFSALQRAIAPALRGEVDAVLHTGDVFDRSRPPAREIERCTRLLREVARRVPVAVIAGNHDRCTLRRKLPTGLPGLQIVDRPQRVSLGDVVVAALPYQRSAASFDDALRRLWAEGADLVACHQAFHGVTVPRNFTFRIDRQRDTVGVPHLPPGVQWILCGHIHPRQAVRVGGATVVHPGSTERTAWSEAGQVKGYAIIDIGAEVRWRFVDLPTRPMRRVDRLRDLGAVCPGDLVRCAPAIPRVDVLERGGWLAAPRQPRKERARPTQVAMFRHSRR